MTSGHVPWWQQIDQWARDAARESPGGQLLMGGDLAATAAADGIVFTPMQGAYQPETEPDVYMGRTPFQGTADHPTPPTDTLLPLSQAQGNIYTWDREQIIAFQDQAIAAGLLDARQISRGARDVATVAAWSGLAQQSADAYLAGARLSPFDLLNELSANPLPGAAGQPFTAVVSHPDDIRAGVKEASREMTGSGKLTPQQEQEAIAAWQAEQQTSQRTKYDAAKAGGVVTEGRSFAEFAKERAQRINPVGFSAHQMLDKFSVIESMLGGQSA